MIDNATNRDSVTFKALKIITKPIQSKTKQKAWIVGKKQSDKEERKTERRTKFIHEPTCVNRRGHKYNL